MSSFYRSSPQRSRRRPKRKKKRRFWTPSVAVFDPRRLLPDAPPDAPPGRRRKRRRKTRAILQTAHWNLSHYTAILLLLAGVVALGYISIDASFYVYSPDITNNRYTSEEQILRTMKINGTSIFFVNPQALEEQLTHLGHVQSATVRTELPGRLYVQVQEWEPVLIYKVNGRSWWVSTEGRVAPVADDRELIVLEDIAAALPIDEKHINPDIVAAVQHIHRSLPETTNFHYDDQQGLWFTSPENWIVKLGWPDDIAAKIALWEDTRDRLLRENQEVQIVDLRYRIPVFR